MLPKKQFTKRTFPLHTLFRDFSALLYPSLCAGCGHNLYKGEDVLCLQCLQQLPLTNFHLHRDNLVERALWGRCNIDAATALLYFKKGTRVQQMLHQLKYNGREDVGLKLGNLLGTALKEEPLFATVDAIVPVPLHKKKQQQRGYNQSERIAAGIANVLKIEVLATCLQRTQFTNTQTHKNRYERYLNTSEVFLLHDENMVRNKKLLLVDDVITTGATIEACTRVLQQANARVCIATAAYAQ